MNRKYSIVMRTVDRQPKAKNYVMDTLANLERAGLFRSAIPFVLTIVTDHAGSEDFIKGLEGWFEKYPHKIRLSLSEVRLTPNQNGALALELAVNVGAPWVIFLEDDIDVGADWLESVDAWLTRVAQPERYQIFPLCAAYKGVRESKTGSWEYPVKDFYGTQAYCLRAETAESVLTFYRGSKRWKKQKKGHDMMLKDWAGQQEPAITHFLTPAPSMVQHLGEESSLHLGRFHKYESWPGRDWSYYREVTGNSPFTLAEQAHRPFSPKLAEALAEYLPKSVPVHDLGCGLGTYVKALKEAGHEAYGYEGTAGVAEKALAAIWHADLTTLVRPESFGVSPGSVICLEVAEHIPKQHTAAFLSTLASFCDEHLVLSWAVKGQGGKRHVNELNWNEVLPLLRQYGFVYVRSEALRLRELAGRDLKWFSQSIYVFKKVKGD